MIHKLDDMTDDAVLDALMALGRHVPAGVEFGRPRTAQRDGNQVLIMTDLAFWWVSEAAAVRLLPLAGELAERTEFRAGVEQDRIVGAARPAG